MIRAGLSRRRIRLSERSTGCLRRIDSGIDHEHTRLVFIPGAGSGATSMKVFTASVRAGYEVYAVQLPGREDRLSEPLVPDLRTLASIIADDLLKLTEKRTVLVGHSMGALLAYEVTQLLQRVHQKSIDLLVVAGYKAPSRIGNTVRPRSTASKEEILADIRKMGGTPDELLNANDIMDFILPIIRSDYEALDNYKYNVSDQKVLCPILVFNGRDDYKVDEQGVLAWQEHSNKKTEFYWYEGGHFFFKEQCSATAILDVVHYRNTQLLQEDAISG